VGWIDANDWMDYTVNVSTAGQYTVSYRTASLNGGGSVQVRSGTTTLATTAIPSTGGWQTWTTVNSTTFSLSAGTQTIRIFAGAGGFNLNWMQFNSSTNPPPTTNITSPSNGATFTAPANITISAAASDNGSVTKVDFYNGGTLLGTDSASPYSFSWTNVAVGTYSLTTKATDNQGAVTTSAIVSITVNGSNTPPTTSITSPSNGASFTAPASVTINASASDANGTITRVEFFQGSTKLGEDTSSPYSLAWTNVSAGSYNLTTKATDNAGATSTSSVVTITVTGGTGCSYPQYVENGGYVAGSLVKNAGSWYECKPHPFSGWCNGAAWAYAPGTGTYWSDAWILRGSCTARADAHADETAVVKEITFQDNDGLVMFPNPGKVGKENTITLAFKTDPGQVSIHLYDLNGNVITALSIMDQKDSIRTAATPALPAGVYLLKVKGVRQFWIKKCVIE
jgi:chitinase